MHPWQTMFRAATAGACVVLFQIVTVVPANGQCNGCEPEDYSGGVGTDDFDYYLDGNVDENYELAMDDAAGNWGDAGTSITPGSSGVLVIADSNTPSYGQWCPKGSSCDQSGSGDLGTIRYNPAFTTGLSADELIGLFAHELGHTLGWDNTECGTTIMGSNWINMTGPSDDDVCWYMAILLAAVALL